MNRLSQQKGKRQRIVNFFLKINIWFGFGARHFRKIFKATAFRGEYAPEAVRGQKLCCN